MKKALIIFFLCVTVCICFAQLNTDSTKHLTFKGVPLDGTLDQYVLKMKESGFKLLSMEDGVAMLQGDFAGYKDCSVGVSTLKQKDLVYKIGVLFPNKETWSLLSGNYFDLKQMLVEKYGKPTDEVEKFDGYSQPDDDRSKILAVRMDNCKYYSVWKTDKGEIHLSIDHTNRESFIKLTYLDKINGATIKKHALDDL